MCRDSEEDIKGITLKTQLRLLLNLNSLFCDIFPHSFLFSRNWQVDIHILENRTAFSLCDKDDILEKRL